MVNVPADFVLQLKVPFQEPLSRLYSTFINSIVVGFSAIPVRPFSIRDHGCLPFHSVADGKGRPAVEVAS